MAASKIAAGKTQRRMLNRQVGLTKGLIISFHPKEPSPIYRTDIQRDCQQRTAVLTVYTIIVPRRGKVTIYEVEIRVPTV